MNLQVLGDISKLDIVSVWKKQRYQMIRTALLVNISSLRILQFLIVSDYRFWLEPHDRPASFYFAVSAAQQPQLSSALNLHDQ